MRPLSLTGGVLAGILLIMFIWLLILGVCCAVPSCPLKKSYSPKHVSPLGSSRGNSRAETGGGGDGGGGVLEGSTAPLM